MPNYVLACYDEEMNPRRRSTMEDIHRIVPCLGGDDNLSYFGVYDGHGGRQIADFLEETLENNIFQELRHDDDATIPQRIARAFLITDMMSRKLDICTSGAAVVSALLMNDSASNKRTLYIANAGDSRAVICTSVNDSDSPLPPSGYLGKRLSYDHTADDLSEQQRIKDAGGFITRGRVLGILAVSRSFGDHGMKDFVTAQPHITVTDIESSSSYPFFILACDGVWDVISDQEAVDMIMEKYREVGPFDDAAAMLVRTSMDRGTADNITAVVVFL